MKDKSENDKLKLTARQNSPKKEGCEKEKEREQAKFMRINPFLFSQRLNSPFLYPPCTPAISRVAIKINIQRESFFITFNFSLTRCHANDIKPSTSQREKIYI
jgi:hypothetical protein